MDALFSSFFDGMPGGQGPTLSLLVFAAVAILAFVMMVAVRSRGEVRRRAAGIRVEAGGDERRSLRHASLKAAQRLVDYTNKHFTGEKEGGQRLLRNRLIQAGFLDGRAPTLYFLAGAASAIVLGACASLLVPSLLPTRPQMLWPLVWL
ncbi:MAG: hypothetical protein IT538_02400, partial [Variibacter sp.]|nr:hypothetical protein [Variibacter sp.]